MLLCVLSADTNEITRNNRTACNLFAKVIIQKIKKIAKINPLQTPKTKLRDTEERLVVARGKDEGRWGKYVK